MAETDDEEGSLNLTGFLFGNINIRGELEDHDLLDEDSRRHLSQLSALGDIGNLVKDITDDATIRPDTQDDSNSGWIQKESDAMDYSDISELAEEEETKYYKQAVSYASNRSADEEDDYDADDETPPPSTSDASFILPTIAPAASTLSKEEQDRLAMPPPSLPSGGSGEPPTEQPSPPLPGPLAAAIKVEDRLLRTSKGQTVTELFPEFKPGKVLRFSRLFGPSKSSSLPQQWRNAKRRKKKKKKHGEEDVPANPIRPSTPPLPRPEDCMSDDEDKLMAPWEPTEEELRNAAEMNASNAAEYEEANRACEWRYGPAALWYEMLGVSEDGSDLDYGFRVKEEKDEGEPSSPLDLPPDDCFHMVSQVNWEDDIIWSPEDVKPNIQAMARAGWIPTGSTRTAQAYANQQQALLNQLGIKHPGLDTFLKNTGAAIKSNINSMVPVNTNKPGVGSNQPKKPSKWYSIFPVDNDDLVYCNWEDKIIWDSQAMPQIPSPTVMQLDPNDENIILGIPEDKYPEDKNSSTSTTPKKETKKSKLLLGKNNKNDDDEEDDNKEESSNMFNISNDVYYSTKHTNVESSLEATLGSNLVQHSLPAIELQRPYFPTYMSPQDLRHFHKPPLKKPPHGPVAKPGRHVVYGLLKHIKKKAREREKERLASGGGEMFFMRTPSDLTGMDGKLVLLEYCEEHPALIMAVGMNTRIRNYHKRKPGKDDSIPDYKFGEPVPVHQMSPFLGHLKPGESLQALENNLFRAPIYEHEMPTTDFLIIRMPSGYYIREIGTIFTIGQQCPKFEVPGPNSKKANIHARDFLQIFIYRLFWKSQDDPRRIKMDDIKKAFPAHSESSIRKRLKLCADFKRTGDCCNWWVLKSDFRLPAEEEMRALVSPEQACAYYSMLAAEQRLKDAGYGEKSLFSCDDDNDDSENSKIDDEIRMAPWNTTRAFISAMRGKCQLAVTGSADPTGCGEGFSYIRVPNKPMANKDESAAQAAQIRKQKTVTGTDADLRRLSLKQARQVLRDFGVSDEEIKKLSRWEVIDVVRTMSTEAAKSGEEGMSKFARGSRFTIAEHQERYKEECQRIFELQNRVLSSKEELSTDEASSSEEESDIDELGKNLESMLANKKTSIQLTHEEEEAERRELQRMLSEDKPGDRNGKLSGDKYKDGSKKPMDFDDDSQSIMSCESSNVGRKLVIQRVFKTHEGQDFTRREVVKNQAVIDAYLRIVNKDKNIRAQFASVDEVHKEEIRREKRRIQEQLRRIRRNQEKEKLQPVKKKKEKPPSTASIKLKCGACGQIGHMRTNKNCPLYQEANPGSLSVAMTDEQVAEEEFNMPNDDLVKVEGTKITLGKAFLDQTNELKRKSLVLRFPKESVRKKRRSGVMHCDYLKRPRKSINRRRANPEVAMQLLMEGIINKMKEVDESWPFHTPVNPKTVPDYHKIVKNPIDLQTLRENLRHGKYSSREDFLEACSLLVSNSVLYNGHQHSLTAIAQNMLDCCTKVISEKEEEFIQLEKEINPLLSDDPLVAFSWILENIVMQIKTMPESWPFHKPVNSKQVPDYYEVIKNPMDIETLRQHVQDGMCRSREEFLENVKLLHTNSVLYNGENHEFTKTANSIYAACENILKEHEEQLSKLESEISMMADDASSYLASEPPSVRGPESAENSMDGFPDTSREDESLMGMDSSLLGPDDSMIADGDNAMTGPDSMLDRDSSMEKVPAEPFKHFRKSVAPSKQAFRSEEEEEMIDVEGYESDDRLFRSISDSRIDMDTSIANISATADSETMVSVSQNEFESILLQDLQHSDSDSADDDDEEDDFPFGDGEDDEDDEEEAMEDVDDGGSARGGMSPPGDSNDASRDFTYDEDEDD
ncbi:transcription initiation factor TFIID subunit 1 isoform X2 [Nematostella vectensis]|uniref:transcription initiation factor TFIID subunit 1 isoform X2 n=1 Tax=Nematostella vectensis TaxID=45351 RepID=UPI0020778C8E|nr:transcription initiation factor TFIID subunit 1 isoform X2 [Nematostella vectensis]